MSTRARDGVKHIFLVVDIDFYRFVHHSLLQLANPAADLNGPVKPGGKDSCLAMDRFARTHWSMCDTASQSNVTGQEEEGFVAMKAYLDFVAATVCPERKFPSFSVSGPVLARPIQPQRPNGQVRGTPAGVPKRLLLVA